MASVQCPKTCLWATVLRFLKVCKSADYYTIVEATEIVKSRSIVGSQCEDRTKMHKLASYDHRKLIVGQKLSRHQSEALVTPYDIHLGKNRKAIVGRQQGLSQKS